VDKAIEANSSTANAAQLAFLQSARALALLNLGRLQQSLDVYLNAFEISSKVGDDARQSVLSSNICILHTARGEYEEAIRWGELSVELGESSHSSALQMSYTNLVDAYVLVGRESDAMVLMDRAKAWLVPKRRWKFHCGFLIVSAAFELIRGNVPLALNLSAEMEKVARDREEAVPIHGAYWKLRIFRAAHLGLPGQAEQIVDAATGQLRERCPYQYLDVLAAKTWLEIKTTGQNTSATVRELRLFDHFGAAGRRALLSAQGFLKPLTVVESSRDPALDRISAGA
jgi:tetratricopeptide (TPR) repeat protein